MSRPLRVLIVEDEALLALDLEYALIEMGHSVVGTAGSSQQALRLAQSTRPDLALVDIHLLDGPTGVDVAREIVRCDHAVVLFMTANVKRIPEDFAGTVGVMAKPYTANGLISAVSFIGDALDGGGVPPPPWSLELAPSFAASEDGRFRISRQR